MRLTRSLLIVVLLLTVTVPALAVNSPACVCGVAPMPTPIYPNPTRIEFIGDSITNGTGDAVGGGTLPDGFRLPVYNALVTAGLLVQFAGSLTNGTGLPVAQRSHDGYSGYRIRDIVNFSINTLLDAAHASVVVVLLGTNDALTADAMASAPSRLTGLLDNIHTRLPSAYVLVLTVIPNGDATANGLITTYNASLTTAINSRISGGAQEVLVDTASSVTTADLNGDGTHPTTAGYAKMAVPIAAALVTLLSSCSPRPQPTISTTPTGAVSQLVTVNMPNGVLAARVVNSQNVVTTTPSITSGVATFSMTRVIGTGGSANVVLTDRCGDWYANVPMGV